MRSALSVHISCPMSQYVDLEAECSDDAGDECMQSETEEDRAFIDDDVEEDYSPPPMDLFDSDDDVIAPKKPNKVTVIPGLGVVDGFDHAALSGADERAE